MPVTLVRHTRPAIGPGICYGSTNLDVAESFASDSAAVVDQLHSADVLISSPLLRCQKLAAVIGHALNVEPRIDERIREMDFGKWERLAWSAVPRAELDACANDFLHARPHGGESVAMLRARVMNAMTEYTESNLMHIIVTHSGVMKVAVARGDSEDDFSTSFPYGAILELSTTQEETHDR